MTDVVIYYIFIMTILVIGEDESKCKKEGVRNLLEIL
jgi:hypothetical protein